MADFLQLAKRTLRQWERKFSSLMRQRLNSLAWMPGLVFGGNHTPLIICPYIPSAKHGGGNIIKVGLFSMVGTRRLVRIWGKDKCMYRDILYKKPAPEWSGPQAEAISLPTGQRRLLDNWLVKVLCPLKPFDLLPHFRLDFFFFFFVKHQH